MSIGVALRDWLALEQEAIWTYSFVGARVPELADRARTALAAHRKQRDRLLRLGAKTDSVPLSYDLGPVSDNKQAAAVAQSIERRIQASCLQAFRSGSARHRTIALDGLERAALAELAWGGQPRAYPGLADD